MRAAGPSPRRKIAAVVVGAAMLGAIAFSLGLVAYGELTDASGSTPEGPTAPSRGEGTIGRGRVEATLSPVGDSDTKGDIVLQEVDNLGLQVEVRVLGLPEKPGSAYYAQIHEGECVGDVGESVVGVEAVAMLRPGKMIAMAGEFAHGGEEGPTDRLPGNVDQPITVLGSADGTASVTSLLSDVSLDDVLAEKPMYLDLHAADTREAPTLACATLRA